MTNVLRHLATNRLGVYARDGDAEITMDEMARLRGTINYEVACGFGMRLDKVYV